MKAKYIFGMFFALVIVTFATAQLLGDFDSALSALKSNKVIGDAAIPAAVSSYKYTTDKVCQLDYDSEEVNACEVCISYTLDSQNQTECLQLEYNTTLEQDEEFIYDHISERVRNHYEDTFEFTERSMKDTSKNIATISVKRPEPEPEVVIDQGGDPDEL